MHVDFHPMPHESSSYSMGYYTHICIVERGSAGNAFAGASVMPSTTLVAGLRVEQCKHLGHDGVVVHHRLSTCASAASVCGNQKVISIPRYISIAVDSAVRACSRWPVTA
jgi:hypothetical protein